MNEKKKIGVVIILNILLILIIGSTIAENLNVKIIGTLLGTGSISSIYVKTNSYSNSGLDIFDIERSVFPSNLYTNFYSNVSNNKLAIDSYYGNPRTVYLVYEFTTPLDSLKSLNFSWNNLNNSNYSANFSYYGTDDTYTNLVDIKNMRNSSEYLANVESGTSKIFIKLDIDNYTLPVEETTEETNQNNNNNGGGGGGGGGASTGYWIKTIDQTSNFTSTKETPAETNIILGNRERSKISLNNEDHYIGIVSLSTNSATINVSSKPQQAIFYIGEIKNFDLNGDTLDDLSINLKSITNGKANFYIKEIINKNTVITNDENNIENNQVINQENNSINNLGTDTSINRNERNLPKQSNVMFVIQLIFGIFIILMIVIILIVIIKRKIRHNKIRSLTKSGRIKA